MNEEKKLTDDVRTFVALFVEFDEMGFAPTTTCPNPEEYARDWKMAMLNKIHRLQNENERLTRELDEEYALRLKHQFACEKKDLELKQLEFENAELKKRMDIAQESHFLAYELGERHAAQEILQDLFYFIDGNNFWLEETGSQVHLIKEETALNFMRHKASKYKVEVDE